MKINMKESSGYSENPDNSVSVPLLLISKILLVYQVICLAFDKEFAALLPLGLCVVFIVLYLKNSNVLLFILFALNTAVLFLPNRFIGLNMLEWALVVLLVVVVGVETIKATGIKYILPYKKEFILIFISLLFSVGYTFLEGRFPVRDLQYGLRFMLFFLPFYMLLNYLRASNFHRTIDIYLLSGFIFVAMIYLFILVLGSDLNEPHRLSVKNLLFSNYVACYLEMFFPLALLMFLGSKSPYRKMIYLILSLMFLANLLLTYSKGALVTVIVVLLFFLWRYLSLRTVAVVSLVAAGFVLLFLAGFSARLNLNDIGELLSAYTRIELYKSAVRMLAGHFYLFGYGINAFAQYKYNFGFPNYLDNLKVLSPHNLYLELFIGLGVIGFIAFIVFVVRIMYRLMSSRTDKLSHVKYGLFLSILSYFVHGLVDCFIIVSSFSIALFCLLAFAEFFGSNVDKLERESWV